MRVPNLVPIGPQATTCIRPEQTDRQTDTHTLSYIDIDNTIGTTVTVLIHVHSALLQIAFKCSITVSLRHQSSLICVCIHNVLQCHYLTVDAVCNIMCIMLAC